MAVYRVEELRVEDQLAKEAGEGMDPANRMAKPVQAEVVMVASVMGVEALVEAVRVVAAPVAVMMEVALTAAATEEEATVGVQGTEAGRRTARRTGSSGLCLSPALQASMQSCSSP